MSQKQRKILLGISGGIAAYRSLELIRLLVKGGHLVRVVMTPNAGHFVTPLSVETLSGAPVSMEMFGRRGEAAIEHIDLATWPDVTVVAPATANILGKFANGIADDLLSTTLCALRQDIPVCIAPAMNTRMWTNPAVQRNLSLLRSDLGRRLTVVDPVEKLLACGEWGVGAMAEPTTIFETIFSCFK